MLQVSGKLERVTTIDDDIATLGCLFWLLQGGWEPAMKIIWLESKNEVLQGSSKDKHC